MSIDWRTAPPKAKYHAFEPDGQGLYHEAEPKAGLMGGWYQLEGEVWISGYRAEEGVDWKATLEERPASVPAPADTDDRYILITLDNLPQTEYGVLDTLGSPYGAGYYRFSEQRGPMGGRITTFFITDKRKAVRVLNVLNERERARYP